jgi:tetratricopeptide (TPR) repeat protein
MADIYIAGKDFNTALDIYNKLINDNRFVQYKQVALIKKADTLRLLRNYKESLAAYKQALDNKYDSQILFKMGELSEEMGDLDAALDNYLKLSYLPGLDQTLAKRALLRAARICEARNNWQEAAKIYNKLIDSKFEEAEYAKDRLNWIEKHIFKPKTK